jgi:hypothetical protein
MLAGDIMDPKNDTNPKIVHSININADRYMNAYSNINAKINESSRANNNYKMNNANNSVMANQ